MDASIPSGPRRGAPTLAALLSEAAARQATTPTVRVVAHAARGVEAGDPHISLFTGSGAAGRMAARFSFEGDTQP